MLNSARILLWRSAIYVALVVVISVFANSIFFEGAGFRPSAVFLMLSIVTLGQVTLALSSEIAELSMLLLALSDAAVAMVLVRVSGSSGSPFLVLFPLMSLAGAVVFRASYAMILSSSIIAFMSMAVGFGISILGNASAILATSFLGNYLMKALRTSGLALSASEGARRRLENLQKAILANIPSGLLSVNSQGRVIQVNGVGTRILRLSENEILGRDLKSLLPEIAGQITKLNTLVPVIEAPETLGGDRPTVKYRRPGADDDVQLGYSVARLADPQDGSVLGWLVVFQDLTDIIRLEDSLRLSEKLAAVGKLAAGIAHEIRNPLAGISGSAQLLSDLTDLGEEDKRLLAIIQRESQRLDALITEFLEYVRPAKPKLECIALDRLVDELIESIKVNPKWQKLSCEIGVRERPASEFKVMGDSHKITQALMNFVLNAGQAEARRVEFAFVAPSRLEVRDDGTGIPPEIRSRIFEPFFTTKEKGTGLGLAISYKALESMDARIEVISPVPDFAAKGGTMFRIDFKSA